MINYQSTIDQLRTAKLIDPNDLVIACMQTPSSAGMFWGGAIGAAIATANCSHYIMSFGNHEIKLFDINKKTGEYLNTITIIEKCNITQLSAATFLQKVIKINCNLGKLSYTTGVKFNGFYQKEAMLSIINYIKTH